VLLQESDVFARLENLARRQSLGMVKKKNNRH
jgi:hypothetical protein